MPYHFKIIHQFGGLEDGVAPWSKLLHAADGKFYGTTQGSNPAPGSVIGGKLFRYDPLTCQTEILHSFPVDPDTGHPEDGSNILSGLIQASDGGLYGAAREGGIHGRGTIFRYDPVSSEFSVVFHFGSEPGAIGYNISGPTGGLIETSPGVFYGATDGQGVVFKLDTNTGSFATVHDLGLSGLNRNTIHGFVRAGDGTLYVPVFPSFSGSISTGIMRVDPITDTVTLVDSANLPPDMGVMVERPFWSASDGGIYGLGKENIPGDQRLVIFRLDPETLAIAIVFAFPFGPGLLTPDFAQGLAEGADGAFYGINGTTYNPMGEIVRVDLNQMEASYAHVFNPDGSEGGYANGHILQLEDGRILGISGGSDKLFELAPSTSAPPMAVPGPDREARIFTRVDLDGSASFDDVTPAPELSFHWRFYALPAGSSAILVDPDSSSPHFVPDVPGNYVVELVVGDSDGICSGGPTVTVNCFNLPPAAFATTDTPLRVVGETALLVGADSTDPEGDEITFQWSITSAPAGSVASLVDDATATASFTPDVSGAYTITLTTSDYLGPGAPASVVLTVNSPAGSVRDELLRACEIMKGLARNQVTSRGNQVALCNFLHQAVCDLDRGRKAQAIDKIKKVIERTDGWILRGQVDGNGPGKDWITDPVAQNQVYPLLKSALDALETCTGPGFHRRHHGGDEHEENKARSRHH